MTMRKPPPVPPQLRTAVAVKEPEIRQQPLMPSAREVGNTPGDPIDHVIDSDYLDAVAGDEWAADEPAERAPTTESTDDDAEAPTGRRKVILKSAAEIDPRRATWLWDRRMAVGTLALLAGREGVGKSTLTYWIVAQVTKGYLPGAHKGTARSVLIAATEDSWAHVIVPRLIAAGADLKRVYRIDVMNDLGLTELSLPLDIERLGEQAKTVNAALLVLDPLMSRLSATLDSHRDAEVRQALEPLVRMLDSAGMTAVGLLHFNKSGSDDPLNALMGSRAFAAVARSVSTVVRCPDDESGRRRLFGTPKNNLGPDSLPLKSFEVVGHKVPTQDGDAETSVIKWGEEVAGSIGDVLRRTNADTGDRTATQEAADWLGDYLRLDTNGGQADSARVKKAGRAAGHSEAALQRARHRLGLRSESSGFPRTTVWMLPEAHVSKGSPTQEDVPVVSPSRGTAGESEITEMNETTDASHSSRSSRSSRGGPREGETTEGQATLLPDEVPS